MTALKLCSKRELNCLGKCGKCYSILICLEGQEYLRLKADEMEKINK